MKLLGNWLILCGVCAVLLASCFDPPTYSNLPVIDDVSAVFVDVADPSIVDSLLLSVKFKDGDGDLGLSASETGCYNISGKSVCFNDKFYYKFADGTYVTYKTKRTKPGYDTLPPFIKPYNCTKWEVTDKITSKLDTFYYLKNPNYNNIFVAFLIQNQTTGVFEEFKWEEQFSYPGCALNFDGRFPILAKDPTQKTPLEGTIRYAMKSVGFLALFGNKAMKLRVTIQDRQLNKSNTAETKPFSLK
jgi:hypothetical protein